MVGFSVQCLEVPQFIAVVKVVVVIVFAIAAANLLLLILWNILKGRRTKPSFLNVQGTSI